MDSLDDKKATSATQVENGSYSEAKPSFFQRTKRHYAKYWWAHVAFFCISFLIICLCLIYVYMPKKAQHDVNASSLSFTDLQFLNPSPNTITLTQKGILHSPSHYTPTLDSFNASLWLVTNGVFGAVPFVNIQMPKIHALHGDSNVSVTDQVVTVLDQAQLSQYAIQVLDQKNVTTALTGRTKLHLGALPTTEVNYNESTTYSTLNGLAGFNVTDAKINLTALTGPNFSGNAYIPNPSIMTVALGNVTLTLSTAIAGVVGNATINDLTIVPGDNNFPMTATINQTLVINSMDTKTGNVDLMITGNNAVYNGQVLPYYVDALKSNVLNLTMNVQQIIKNSL